MNIQSTVWQKNCEKIIRGLIYVMIFWLPYSTAAIETTVILALLVWIFKAVLIFYKKYSDRQSKLDLRNSLIFLKEPNRLWIGLFLAICWISVVANGTRGYSAGGFFTKTAEWFVIYYLVCDSFREEKQFLFLLKVLFFTALATAVDGIFQYYISHRDFFLGHKIIPGESPTAGFKTPNGLGAFIAGVFPLAWVYLFFKEQSVILRAGIFLLNILLLWALLITACRGAMVAVSVTAAAAFVFLFSRVIANHKRRALVLFLMSVPLIFLFLISIQSRNIVNQHKTISANWRLEIWQESIELIKNKPMLGYGVNSFMKEFQMLRPTLKGVQTKDTPTYAHNCFIQMCFETGLLGFFVFLGLTVKILKIGIQNFQKFCQNSGDLSLLSLGFLASFFAMLVHSFFDNHLYSLQLSTFFWLIAGSVVAIRLNLLKQEEGHYA